MNNIQMLMRTNQPLYVYIFINIAILLIIGILEVITFLFKIPFDVKGIIWEYAAFPASINNVLYKIYTIITYQFLHKDLWHLLINMLTLYWFGRVFTDFLKPRQFHFVYILGGVFGALLYSIAFNFFPAFEIIAKDSFMVGASASAMAIAAAAATLTPNYTFHLLLLGSVRIKYLVIFLLIFDVLLLNAGNAGGNFAHIGGALGGFIFIRLLQKGYDLSKWFIKKPKLKVVNHQKTAKKSATNTVSQEEIDRILDKISASGYDGLSSEDKQKLFKASGKN